MPSKPLADYEADIPKVAAALAAWPADQAFFAALTPGYQREWARYLFGVASPATGEAHLQKMREVFAAGFKSKRAYDARKR
ncbi:YdeI/OmpD-associated family protein [Lacticaseibacillus kribbianus]|uniref:YdeI/OmpD-associated family protein n=1 Tax=Lacticaseibacillus kribbianus TaxID=2926292 RepID=UPI001CD4CD2E|nr:YdeI/OmpD-associated family protein [Lacticaseibacillus kribbianus]